MNKYGMNEYGITREELGADGSYRDDVFFMSIFLETNIQFIWTDTAEDMWVGTLEVAEDLMKEYFIRKPGEKRHIDQVRIVKVKKIYEITESENLMRNW